MTNESDTQAAPPEYPLTLRALELLRQEHPDAVVDALTTGRHPVIEETADGLPQASVLLRDHDELLNDCCHMDSGVDLPSQEQIEVLYHLVS